MLYLIALLLPPLAILLAGKLFQALINGILYIIGIATVVAGVGLGLLLICIIHAIFVVQSAKADKRQAELVKAVQAKNR